MQVEKVILPNALMLGEVCRLLDEGRSVVIATKGSSMLPFIKGERDSVLLERLPQIAVGDIALAQVSPGCYVLHRIIAIDGGKVTLKGDGNLVNTESCGVDCICGIATSIIRKGGRKVDCRTAAFGRRSRRWREAPYIVRRVSLAIIRRII